MIASVGAPCFDPSSGCHPAVAGPAGARNALLLGLVYGVVHVVGPDHIGTLMMLSSVASGAKAFRVGAAWGLGHSLGMVLVAGVFMTLHRLVTLNVERWEHYGNYFIGGSMVLCALYFVVRESTFVKQEADGSFTAQPCGCHGCPAAAAAVPAGVPCGDKHLPGRQGRRGPRGATFFCASYCGGSHREEDVCRPCAPEGGNGEACVEEAPEEAQPLLSGSPQACAEEAPEEAQPLLPGGPKIVESVQDSKEQTWWQWAWAERDVKGALLGVFQGACCPVGMLGVGFLANLPGTSIAEFLLTFMLVSSFGTATLAVAWALITARGLGSAFSPRTVYRASCGFTMMLGAMWILCNFFGVLDMLNYAEGIHSL